MGQIIETGLPQINSAFHPASVAQQSRTRPSMSAQLHVKASHAGKHPVCPRSRKALAAPTALPGPASPGGIWPLCSPPGLGSVQEHETPQPHPLAMPVWGETPGQKPGPTRAGDRQKERQKTAMGGQLGLCLLPGTSSTCSLRESLVGYPRAPKSRRKQRQIAAPKGSGPILWPNLVAGWETPRRGSRKEGREKAQLGPNFSGSPISLWQHALGVGHRREN